jgi:hypothetical protein
VGCNCKKRVMQQQTSVNQPVTELDRPDIVAARVAAAQERVAAATTAEIGGNDDKRAA